jgi:hypothetical protein
MSTLDGCYTIKLVHLFATRFCNNSPFGQCQTQAEKSESSRKRAFQPFHNGWPRDEVVAGKRGAGTVANEYDKSQRHECACEQKESRSFRIQALVILISQRRKKERFCNTAMAALGARWRMSAMQVIHINRNGSAAQYVTSYSP